ncbi:MAG: hypothetical protein MMC23_008725 [Stictis urceolatum]|nr:hypothetical protein [Stictis urceolata]
MDGTAPVRLVDLNPPLGSSVVQIGLESWLIGSLYRLEQRSPGAVPPPGAVLTWGGDCKVKFSLYDQEPGSIFPPASCSSFNTFKHSTWLFGDVICKVEPWNRDYEPEYKALKMLAGIVPTVPLPKLIHGWTDEALARSFLLERRAPGKTIDEAAPNMTANQLARIADQVASHAKAMWKIKSPRLQTLSGKCIHGSHTWADVYIRNSDSAFHQMKGRPIPSYDVSEFIELLRKLDVYGERADFFAPKDTSERMFALAHPELTPNNILVQVNSQRTEDANISAIIDWENLAFYPWFYPNYCVRGGWAMLLTTLKGAENLKWNRLLSESLSKVGFDALIEWTKRVEGGYHERFLKATTEGEI